MLEPDPAARPAPNTVEPTAELSARVAALQDLHDHADQLLNSDLVEEALEAFRTLVPAYRALLPAAPTIRTDYALACYVLSCLTCTESLDEAAVLAEEAVAHFDDPSEELADGYLQLADVRHFLGQESDAAIRAWEIYQQVAAQQPEQRSDLAEKLIYLTGRPCLRHPLGERGSGDVLGGQPWLGGVRV